jgi:hypothetical protein
MAERFGRGLFGSLNAHVNYEIRELARTNPTLRRARYPLGRRLLRAIVIGRSVGQLLLFYLAILAITLFSEWENYHYMHRGLSNYSDYFETGFIKDLSSYLIAAQIGILAIVSVAVGVVTLLSERNNGASVNTDIRLYYVESYSYELATSGVALLLVLTVQLFWPFHQMVHAMGVGGSDDWFKFVLSVIHALWFCINLLLFLQFITTTLRFVEPNARETLRERYSANEVIPRDAKTRLLRALYAHAAVQMFGDKELQEGPRFTFGYHPSWDDQAKSEISIVFRAPSKLVDVRLRPLRWVFKRWQTRVRKRPQNKAHFGQPLWEDSLSVTPSFDSTQDGQCALVLRRGEVALTGLEKWIIRRCFRFVKISSRTEDMPDPNDFLEQLIDKLVRQIEQGTVTGFSAALDEVIRYHRFILATQNTKDEAGNPFNLAEVGGNFIRPDADWVRQYRRAFTAAADKIGSDTSFVDYLGHLTSRLVPEDGLNFSRRVLETLLDLGLYEVVALEDWVTRRAVIGSAENPTTSPALAGSDKRAYEKALVGFVGSWESLLQTLMWSLSVARRTRSSAMDEQWNAFAKGFPVFQTHLHYAAYFFAASVWNDDAQGADRFRDSLLRWPQPFYERLQEGYLFSNTNTLFITPDLTSLAWTEVQAKIADRMRFGQGTVLPAPASGMLLWESYCDVVCVSGLIALHWYATGQQPSSTAANAAILTLRLKKRDSDGSDLTATNAKSTFRLLFDFAIRYALNPRFAESRYSATIDGLIRRLTDLASQRMVTGRIYGGVGIDGFDTLRPVLLASMAANLPAQGDGWVAALVEELKADVQFSSDKSLRSFIWTMQQVVRSIDLMDADETYSKAAYLFNAELDLTECTKRLRAIFSDTVASFEILRKERLQASPLDEHRVNLVRHAMSRALLEHGPVLTCFRDYEIRCDTSNTIPEDHLEFGFFSKGSFTLPEMSDVNFDELPGYFVELLRRHISSFFWHGLYNRPKRTVSVDFSNGTDPFWQRAVAEASGVGPVPMLIVPYAGFGEDVVRARIINDDLAGFAVTHEATTPSGGGAGYLGSVNGIPVFSANLSNRALLCSSYLLRVINYGIVHAPNDVVDFSFVDNDDLEKSRVQVKFAQRLEWADDVFVEFTLNQVNEN